MDFEEEFAKEHRLQQVTGSGCGKFRKGDLISKTGYFELKATRKERFCLPESWVLKAIRNAKIVNKPEVFIVIKFTTPMPKYSGPIVFVLLVLHENVAPDLVVKTRLCFSPSSGKELLTKTIQLGQVLLTMRETI